MIGIIDYGVGNIASIQNMLKKISVTETEFVKKPDRLLDMEKIILPGIGAFDTGMKLLNDSGLKEALDIMALEKKIPILGICLGMQMLGQGSQEGNLEGLGYIRMKCQKFKSVISKNGKLKVPHMGWDYVKVTGKSELADGLNKELERYYFVHSYYEICDDVKDVLMTCAYGVDFAAAVAHENIYGVQFHPEKSHKYGMKLLKNFACL